MTKAEDDITGFPDEMLGGLLASRLQPMDPIPTGIMPGGGLRNTLKCILFDIYGTLLISGSGDISVARESVRAPREVQVLLDEFGITIAPKKLLGAFFDKIRDAHRAAKQKGDDYPEVQIDQIWALVLGNKNMPWVRRFALEFEIMTNPVWPMPHLEALLSACRKAGLPMGIISNAQFYTPMLLRWFLKSDPAVIGFVNDLLVYSFELGCAKPSPKLFNLATSRLRKMGILPEEVLYMGNDVQKDILPAKLVGFQTALFAGDARSLRLEGDGLPADLVITDLKQLLPHINSRTEH